MPNWLGDIIMSIPVLLAIRKGRPDIRFNLVCKKEFIPLLKKFALGENYICLPEKSWHYFLSFQKLINIPLENYLLFTNSMRGDIEAFLTGCPQRFGLVKNGRRRPFLSHVFNASKKIQECDFSEMHQTVVWEKMANYFGLREKLNFSCLVLPEAERIKTKIGIVAGSSNSPEKRWSVSNWVSLVKKNSQK